MRRISERSLMGFVPRLWTGMSMIWTPRDCIRGASSSIGAATDILYPFCWSWRMSSSRC